ncbi:NAD-dependent deacylase [Haloarcula pellucida]|uniref:NAD-dependent deacetylase n=1 Tax=Haloarcula pellucida TaxID=1427151 RepID=A0A830GK00_9EURY|nr:NAD-dependent deacylase [Halomicroarcula pellucida]MBX0347266.1 NAD-dependent deacylase [Halomicroarcula pellucida]GGN87821.1 NAD-dependent deacetylase [Halomicroarcula pellucida]
MSEAYDDAVDAITGALRDADTAVALTGAGVSTASGIPSFRGEDGIWERRDPTDFHRRRLDADPEGFWRDRLELRAEFFGDVDPTPNAAHLALAELESRGHLDAVVTQNVDGLHDAAGSERVVELHGTNRRVRCDDCGDRLPADAAFERAADGDLPPRCPCGGIYRPDVVLFGESLPDVAMSEAQRLARDSDVFLAVGSSLSVRPASLLPKIAADAEATLVVVNFEETPRDSAADHVIRADVTDVLPAVVDRL